jgi:hypothetical protein
VYRENKNEEVLKIIKAIPYRSFKERLRIIKQELSSKVIIEVYKDFIYIESRDGRE